MTQTGNCPKCGFPIWSTLNLENPLAPPRTIATCDCHKSLQAPAVPLYVPIPLYPYTNPNVPYIQPVQPINPMEVPPWVTITCSAPK